MALVRPLMPMTFPTPNSLGKKMPASFYSTSINIIQIKTNEKAAANNHRIIPLHELCYVDISIIDRSGLLFCDAIS
jgi:hypothetical protein